MAYGDVGGPVTELVITCQTKASAPSRSTGSGIAGTARSIRRVKVSRRSAMIFRSESDKQVAPQKAWYEAGEG